MREGWRKAGLGAVCLCVSAVPIVRAGDTCAATAGPALVAGDGAAIDLFGQAVALSTTHAAAGAWNDETPLVTGSVYLYARGAGLSFQQKIVPADGAAFDRFGWSVDLDGTTLAVGADSAAGAVANSGAVYVYTFNGATWTLQQRIAVPSAASGDRFGASVSLSGNTLLIGAPNDDERGADAGAAYVYVRTGSTWGLQRKLVASDAANGDNLGRSVALFGDLAVLGASGHDAAGADAGAAYPWRRSGTSWTAETKILHPNPGAGDQFGFSVAMDADTLLVGAPQSDLARPNGGSTVVYQRVATSWDLIDRWTADVGAANDQLGASVAIDGPLALVGSVRDDTLAADAGAAMLFREATPGSWLFDQRITATGGASGDLFGFAVALQGELALVGAPQDDPAGQDSGAAYPFEIVCGGSLLLGDLNCDGTVSVSDIGPFVLAITDAGGYADAFPDCDINAADLNKDATISVSDIGPFVALLTGG